MSDKIREEQLQAIAEKWREAAKLGCVDALECALKDAWQAALSQQQAPVAVLDGWKLVPVEPTKDMLDEFDSIVDYSANDSADAWSRMLAAAPAAPAAPAPAAQEPVAWIIVDEPFHGTSGAEAGEWDVEFERKAIDELATANSPGRIPLYTAPPAAEQPRMWMAKDERAIRELLAVINRDGGQHQHNVGIAQAACDALEEFDRIRQELAEQPESARSILTDDDMRRLRHFQEICEDSDACGHDLPKEAVKRLERAGALRSCGFGRHEITLFGDYLLGKDGEA